MALADTMKDDTNDPSLTLLLVPGVAFDARCGRLGHGRGYYDAFIARQRALTRVDGVSLLVVGLALTPQIVDAVPMGEGDQRVDIVITPDGPLAYTSEADQALAAQLSVTADSVAGMPEAGGGAALSSAAPAQRVELASGRYKYVCMRLTRTGMDEALLAVRSAPGSYHANVAEPAMEAYYAMGYTAVPLGGGRIMRDDAERTVHVYGYSVGFGGNEGGPPGRGMKDHSEAAALIRLALPDYTVTFSADGY